MRNLNVILATIAVLIAGCRGTDERNRSTLTDPTPDAAPALVLDDLTTDQQLLMIEHLPLGVSYAHVQARFRDVGPEQPEGMGTIEHLTEAFLNTQIWDRDVVLEFNFENDSLYSYYYHLEELDCEEADSIYAHLQEFYADAFGSYDEEDGRDPPYRSRSSFWVMQDPAGGLAISQSYRTDDCRLGWGFQESAP